MTTEINKQDLSDGSPMPTGAEFEIKNLEVDEVSPVGRPAIKRKFLIVKSDGTTEIQESDIVQKATDLSDFCAEMEAKYDNEPINLGDMGADDVLQTLLSLRKSDEIDSESLLELAEDLSDTILDKEGVSDSLMGAETKEDLLGVAVYHLTLAYHKVEQESYAPTDAMKEAAKRGLEWRSEYGRGGTAVGIARARDIVNGRELPLSTVKRMYSFFSRHEVDKKAVGFRRGEDGFPSNGKIAWELWGGDAGFSWSKKIVKKAQAQEKSSEDTEILDHVQTAQSALFFAANATEEDMVRISKGKSLGTLLTSIIAKKATNRKERSDLIQKLADKAGITTEAVYMILTAKIKCPPTKRLSAFADVLGVSEETLKAAARKDGCQIDKQEREPNMSAKLVFDPEKQAVVAEVTKEDGTVERQEFDQDGLLDSIKKAVAPTEQETPVQKSEQESDGLRKQIEDLKQLVVKQGEELEKLTKAAPVSNAQEPENKPQEVKKNIFAGIL